MSVNCFNGLTARIDSILNAGAQMVAAGRGGRQ